MPKRSVKTQKDATEASQTLSSEKIILNKREKAWINLANQHQMYSLSIAINITIALKWKTDKKFATA